MSTKHQSVFRRLGLLQFGQGQTENECHNQHLSVHDPNPPIMPQPLDHSPSPSDTSSTSFNPSSLGRKACPEPTSALCLKCYFYQQNLPTGAANTTMPLGCKEDLLQKAERLFDPPASAGFHYTTPAWPAAGVHRSEQAGPAPTLDRLLALALANSLQNNTHMIASI